MRDHDESELPPSLRNVPRKSIIPLVVAALRGLEIRDFVVTHSWSTAARQRGDVADAILVVVTDEEVWDAWVFYGAHLLSLTVFFFQLPERLQARLRPLALHLQRDAHNLRLPPRRRRARKNRERDDQGYCHFHLCHRWPTSSSH